MVRSKQAASWASENNTVLMYVLEVLEMYCGVEDINRHGGHRERAQRERERQERDDPPGIPPHPNALRGSRL